jgi:hypothetical protein
MYKKSDINRKMLLEHLSEGFCKVQFRKSTTGRFRSLTCTLNQKKIPSKYAKSVAKTFETAEDPNLLPVYDIISGQWKSFFINNAMYMYTEAELRGKKKKKT